MAAPSANVSKPTGDGAGGGLGAGRTHRIVATACYVILAVAGLCLTLTGCTESATGRLFDVTPQGEVVWEYVIPYFGEYQEAQARRYTPGVHNSVFRSYRYQRAQIPWL